MAEIVKELEVPKRFNYDYSKKDLSCFLGNHLTIKLIHDIYYNIAFSNIFCENGARPKKSFLLEGENGTGKTLAVKCIVGELFKRGINTHVEEYSIGTHGSHFVDKGSINLQEFFTKAQEKLKSENGIQRLIYLFDEAEVLMGQRGGENHDENDKRINTLMTNLQKIHDSDSQEYLFFITNEPKLMDKASIRSQRIDQVIEFTLPEVGPRRQLFQYSIQQINQRANREVIQRYDAFKLAELSEEFNCADCVEVPERALQQEIINYIKNGEIEKLPHMFITQEKLLIEIKNQIEKYRATTKRKIGFFG